MKSQQKISFPILATRPDTDPKKMTIFAQTRVWCRTGCSQELSKQNFGRRVLQVWVDCDNRARGRVKKILIGWTAAQGFGAGTHGKWAELSRGVLLEGKDCVRCNSVFKD